MTEMEKSCLSGIITVSVSEDVPGSSLTKEGTVWSVAGT